jgi:hypothetical protein
MFPTFLRTDTDTARIQAWSMWVGSTMSILISKGGVMAG